MRYLLHDVFTETVKRSPYAFAIVNEYGKSITYQELNELSNKFANLFLQLKSNIRTAPYIGIISSVHETSIACILGALKVGCAYIPLDEFSPAERLSHIIQNTEIGRASCRERVSSPV